MNKHTDAPMPPTGRDAVRMVTWPLTLDGEPERMVIVIDVPVFDSSIANVVACHYCLHEYRKMQAEIADRLAAVLGQVFKLSQTAGAAGKESSL